MTASIDAGASLHDKVIIVGCGKMGRDIAAVFLHASYDVDAITKNPDKWPDHRTGIEQSVEDLRHDETAAIGSLAFTRRLEEIDWKRVRLVIESVREDYDLKVATFKKLDRLAPREVILVTNSSSFGISKIAAACNTADRMANLHFFLPAHIAPLVEVVRGKATSDFVISELRSLMKRVGRIPVQVQSDIPGFLANRIQHALMREAWALLDQGIASPQEIDDAVRFGFAYRYVSTGPLMQADIEGLDTELTAAQKVYPQLHNNTTPAPLLKNLVNQGKTGIDAYEGIWKWTSETAASARSRYKETLQHVLPWLEENADLREQIPHDTAREARTVGIRSELVDRLEHALKREAWALLEAGVASAEDIDLAVRLGFGFRYVAAGPLMQKELTGLDTQLAAAREIYPDLNKSTQPSAMLQRVANQQKSHVDTSVGLWGAKSQSSESVRTRRDETSKRILPILQRSLAYPHQLSDDMMA